MVARSVRRGAVLVPNAAPRTEVLSRWRDVATACGQPGIKARRFCGLGAEGHWLGGGGALSGALRLLLGLTYNFLYGPREVDG